MDDVKDRARAFYETHRMSFKQLSDVSESVLGQSVTIDQLKTWSQADNGWHKKTVTPDERLKVIADKIFETIEQDDDLPAKDLAQLANVYLSFATKKPEASTEDAKPTLQQIIDVANTL